MARVAMAQATFGVNDPMPAFAAARYGLPPLPPGLLIRELSSGDDLPDEAGGPGWYQSSRELRRGLQVCDAPFDDWLLASFFMGIPPLQAAA